MHPVGFIIRIYHDARSPEGQKCKVMFVIRDNICLGITHIDGEQMFYSTVLPEFCHLMGHKIFGKRPASLPLGSVSDTVHCSRRFKNALDDNQRKFMFC